jgi:hypothetical protein
MKRALLIALLGCGCHAYDQAYLDCMNAGHCVDSPDAQFGGIHFDDDSTVILNPTRPGLRSFPATRQLINEANVSVAYALYVDPQLQIDFAGVDGGPGCDAMGIPARSVCRWDISLLPHVYGTFSSTIIVDAGTPPDPQLNVQCTVIP